MRVRMFFKGGEQVEYEPKKIEIYEFLDLRDRHDTDDLYRLQFTYTSVNLEEE